MRAGDEAGDVVEGDGVGDDLAAAEALGELIEALVVHRHDRDVRLDRRERVVRGLRPRLREGVEQRALARVRHSDDPDLHRAAWYAPALPRGSAGVGDSASPALAGAIVGGRQRWRGGER